MFKKVWTIEMKEKLIREYPKRKICELVLEFGLSAKAIQHKAGKMGLCKFRKFNKKEDEILKAFYSNESNEFIMSMLPKRNLTSIYMRAYYLGLKKTKRYSQTETEIIKCYYSDTSVEFIKNMIPDRSIDSINYMAYKLGCKKTKPSIRLSSIPKTDLKNRLRQIHKELPHNAQVEISKITNHNCPFIHRILNGKSLCHHKEIDFIINYYTIYKQKVKQIQNKFLEL